MISKYSRFTESSNSSSSTISNLHNFHHINSFPHPMSPQLYSPLQIQNPYYQSPYISYPSYPSNLSLIGNQIISPPNSNSNYYSHKTISYPQNRNNLIKGEPVPVHEDLRNKGCNSYIKDILYLLQEMKGLPIVDQFKGIKQGGGEESENSDEDSKKAINKLAGKKSAKSKKKSKKEKEEEKKRQIQTAKWWKLAKNFIDIYSYYCIAKKYATHYSQIRNSLIETRTYSLIEEINLLKEWVLSLEEPCWEEFEIFIDENCAFQKGDTRNKIRRESQKIILVIKKYVEYLMSGSSKLNKIPERIQQIIYEFIKDGGYFPKKYLTTFQICRLDFEFYGATKNLTEEQAAMILAFLLLSVIASQEILCNIRETVSQFRNYANVIISSRYIASILHYLTRDTFKNDVDKLDDICALFNYYRNYHLQNEFIEKKKVKDISKEDYNFEGLPNADEDEYGKYFITEEEIGDFFTMNSSFVEAFRNYIFIWAIKLAKLIKDKFSEKDPNLLPRKPMQKPEDKIFKEKEE